jgi:hypothetical protein
MSNEEKEETLSPFYSKPLSPEERVLINAFLKTLLTSDGRGEKAKKKALINLVSLITVSPTDFILMVEKWDYKQSQKEQNDG